MLIVAILNIKYIFIIIILYLLLFIYLLEMCPTVLAAQCNVYISKNVIHWVTFSMHKHIYDFIWGWKMT